MAWRQWLLMQQVTSQEGTTVPQPPSSWPMTPEQIKAAGEARKKMFLSGNPDAEVVNVTRAEAKADRQLAARLLDERGKRQRAEIDRQRKGGK